MCSAMQGGVDGPLPQFPFVGHVWRCAQGPEARRGDFSPAISAALFSPPFLPGEAVSVDLGSNTKHSHAIVLDYEGAPSFCSSSCSRAPPTSESCAKLPGPVPLRCAALIADELEVALERRVLVSARPSSTTSSESSSAPVSVRTIGGDGGVLHTQVSRLVRVLTRAHSASPQVLIVADTVSFRRLAKSQVGYGDAVLEVGSSLGECTCVLASRAAAVVGIDVAGELVEESRRRHPHCRFEWLDCFEEPGRLRSLCEGLRARGELKLFVDVGGDRTTQDVCRVLAALGAATSSEPPPSLIVVKSHAMAVAAAASAHAASGEIEDTAGWWRSAARTPPNGSCSGSARQLKKKLARARKAKWDVAGEDEWKAFNAYRAKWEDVPSEEYELMAAEARQLKDARPEAWGNSLRAMIGGGRSTGGPKSAQQ